MIEGFLDVILPVTDLQRRNDPDVKIPSQESLPSGQTSGQSTLNHEGKQSKLSEEGKHLFTVKPGGIAGYLCERATKLRYGPFTDPSSIVVQHGLVREYQSKDRHMCGIPPASCS